jgi:hypothetical protein
MASSLMGVTEMELLQGEVAVAQGMGREELALAAVRQLARDAGVNPHHVRIVQTPSGSSCDWVISPHLLCVRVGKTTPRQVRVLI